jgi:hypothetical protein
MSMHVAAIAAVKRSAWLLLLFAAALSAHAQSGTWGERGISRAFVLRGTQLFDVDGRGVTTYEVGAVPKRVAMSNTIAESIDGTFIDANTLAIATTGGIDTFNAAADGHLTPLGHVDLAGIQHLRSNGKWLVAAGGKSVKVYSADLTLQRTLSAQNAVAAIALAGDILYLAEGAAAASIVDLSGANDDATLTEVANDIAIEGNTMAIASGVDGLALADLSDPAAPHVTARIGAGEMNLAHVVISGTRVYASEAPDIVREFDISDPNAPRLVATMREPAMVLAANASRVFVSGSFFDQFGDPTETGVPLRVLDGASLAIAGTVSDLAGPVSGVATDGSLAYVVDGALFRVIDVSTTNAPRELSSMPIEPEFDFVKVSGTQVILYGRGDTQLLDVSNPYALRSVGTFRSAGHPPSNAAFTRTNVVEGNAWSGFHVIDFWHYSPPAQVGGVKMHYFEVVSDGGDVVYISAEGRALGTFDLTDVAAPQVTNFQPMVVNQMTIVPSTAAHPELLLVRTNDAIKVFSLANPLAPAELSGVPAAAATLLASGDQSVLVATGADTARLDVSDPSHPVTTPSGFFAIAPMQIAIANGKTVIANRYSLRIYGPNTAAPPAPHRRAARP